MGVGWTLSATYADYRHNRYPPRVSTYVCAFACVDVERLDECVWPPLPPELGLVGAVALAHHRQNPQLLTHNMGRQTQGSVRRGRRRYVC
jgi:hypothetical protein